MNIRDFKEGFQINKNFLDTIDFIPFLKQYTQLGDMMGAIEEYCYENDIELPLKLETEVFNYYSEEEFKDYLEKRYAKKVYFYPIEDYLIDFRDWEENNDYQCGLPCHD